MESNRAAAGTSNASGDHDASRISQVSRMHPLYPMLQHIAQKLRHCQESIDARTRKTANDCVSLTETDGKKKFF